MMSLQELAVKLLLIPAQESLPSAECDKLGVCPGRVFIVFTDRLSEYYSDVEQRSAALLFK